MSLRKLKALIITGIAVLCVVSCKKDDEGNIVFYGDFQSYSAIQKYLEDNNFDINSAEFERIPNDYKTLTEEQKASVQKLLDKIEEDEDVQNVYHNMAE